MNAHIQRFIPALAGNIRRTSNERAYPAVYPRVGGEHDGSETLGSQAIGSSPRSGNLVEAHCPRFLSCARLCAVGSQPIWRA